jgi:hypothetical protein
VLLFVPVCCSYRSYKHNPCWKDTDILLCFRQAAWGKLQRVCNSSMVQQQDYIQPPRPSSTLWQLVLTAVRANHGDPQLGPFLSVALCCCVALQDIKCWLTQLHTNHGQQCWWTESSAAISCDCSGLNGPAAPSRQDCMHVDMDAAACI